MNNRTRQFENEDLERESCREPQPIGVILAELLAHYQARFPDVRVTVVETPAAAVWSPLLCQGESSMVP